MLLAAVVIEGGLKFGTRPLICIRFRPELKPLMNAALEAAAAVCALPGSPGASCPFEMKNVFLVGGLVSNAVASVPGKTSEKSPKPPRITVLPFPNGCHANPTRGSQLML